MDDKIIFQLYRPTHEWKGISLFKRREVINRSSSHYVILYDHRNSSGRVADYRAV